MLNTLLVDDSRFNGRCRESIHGVLWQITVQWTWEEREGSRTITGIFQCRGDLSNGGCYKCVRELPLLSDKLCGQTVGPRVLLYGRCVLYEVAAFAQVLGMQFFYKACVPKLLKGVGLSRRGTALSVMTNGVVNGHGYNATKYQGVYVLGQCEGDVGECVKSAVQRAPVECASNWTEHREDGGYCIRRVAAVAFLVIHLIFARNVRKA